MPLTPTPPAAPRTGDGAAAAGGGRVVVMAPIMTCTVPPAAAPHRGAAAGVGAAGEPRPPPRSRWDDGQQDAARPPPRMPPPAVAVMIAGSGFGGDGRSTLQRGSRVRIEGLLSQPEHNGTEGAVKKLLPDDRVWIKLVRLHAACRAACLRARSAVLLLDADGGGAGRTPARSSMCPWRKRAGSTRRQIGPLLLRRACRRRKLRLLRAKWGRSTSERRVGYRAFSAVTSAEP
jgi:hypothetical protein